MEDPIYGVSTYTYNHANLLTSVVQRSDTYEFAYSGLGDRLQQTFNGLSEIHTLDINRSLSQVLADGITPYLYGLGRIGEEQPAGWQYHLTDGLGSTRQLVNETGSPTSVRSFQPFGSDFTTSGSAESNYGFTGEWSDKAGLVHLRARYYLPGVGRFLQRDTWSGDKDLPQSFHPWLYVLNNPTTLTDPSGHWYCVGAPNCEIWISMAIQDLSLMGWEGQYLRDEFERYDQGIMAWQSLNFGSSTVLDSQQLRCTSGGFRFEIQEGPPSGFSLLTRPRVIYVWRALLAQTPDAFDASLLGHEFHHLTQQQFLLAISVQGELLAAQVQARLYAIKQGDKHPTLILSDGRYVTDLRANHALDLELYREKGYPWPPHPLAPPFAQLVWCSESEFGDSPICPSPVPTPDPSNTSSPSQTPEPGNPP